MILIKISETNKKIYNAFSDNEKLQFHCFSSYLNEDINDNIEEYQRLKEENKLKTLKLNSKCRKCGSNDNSVEYGEHYLICIKCKKSIMKAWRYNYTHYKQVPWNIRAWLDEEKKVNT